MARKRPDTDQRTFESLRPTQSSAAVSYAGDKPNPELRGFVERNATPYDPTAADYTVPAFNKPIETTKATAIYNMHVYWSKKPHTAIRQYIRHYTQPGDIVLDPFCGSGGTARTLADWIRQCHRAGLFEQGRVLYEKGGLSLDRLNEAEQLEVEDDYRICVRRGGAAETRPRRQRRKTDNP
jgi:hypothetical protein